MSLYFFSLWNLLEVISNGSQKELPEFPSSVVNFQPARHGSEWALGVIPSEQWLPVYSNVVSELNKGYSASCTPMGTGYSNVCK